MSFISYRRPTHSSLFWWNFTNVLWLTAAPASNLWLCLSTTTLWYISLFYTFTLTTSFHTVILICEIKVEVFQSNLQSCLFFFLAEKFKFISHSFYVNYKNISHKNFFLKMWLIYFDSTHVALKMLVLWLTTLENVFCKNVQVIKVLGDRQIFINQIQSQLPLFTGTLAFTKGQT